MFALVYGVGSSYDFGVWLYGCDNDLSCDEGNPNTITDRYYHLVATYDESSQRLQTYINGVAYKNKIVAINTNSSKISIGQYNYNGQPLQSIRQLDDLRIYNRALTEAEILELYEGKEKVASSIDLSLALTAPTSVKTAEKATYQLTATNNGNAPATGVKAHFVVPRKSIATVDIPKNCTLNGRIIECALSDLGANQSATQTFSMTALRKGALSVVGLVSSNADDANYDDNKKSVVVSVK